MISAKGSSISSDATDGSATAVMDCTSGTGSLGVAVGVGVGVSRFSVGSSVFMGKNDFSGVGDPEEVLIKQPDKPKMKMNAKTGENNLMNFTFKIISL
jgi:hypothetical protein